MEYQWIFFCIFLNFIFLTCQPSRVHCVKLEPVSGSSLPESMPEGPAIPEATDQTNQSGAPLPDMEGPQCFENLRSEVKILKEQIVVALSKVTRAAEREDYLLELIWRASDDVRCKFRKAPMSLS